MRLWLLQALVVLQAERSRPLRTKDPVMNRFWTLVAATLCWELPVALWLMGGIRPLSPLW